MEYNIDRYTVAIDAVIVDRITYSLDKYDIQDYKARHLFWPWYGRPLLAVL